MSTAIAWGSIVLATRATNTGNQASCRGTCYNASRQVTLLCGADPLDLQELFYSPDNDILASQIRISSLVTGPLIPSPCFVKNNKSGSPVPFSLLLHNPLTGPDVNASVVGTCIATSAVIAGGAGDFASVSVGDLMVRTTATGTMTSGLVVVSKAGDNSSVTMNMSTGLSGSGTHVFVTPVLRTFTLATGSIVCTDSLHGTLDSATATEHSVYTVGSGTGSPVSMESNEFTAGSQRPNSLSITFMGSLPAKTGTGAPDFVTRYLAPGQSVDAFSDILGAPTGDHTILMTYHLENF